MVFTAQLFQLSVCLKIFIIKYLEKCAKKGIIFHNYFKECVDKSLENIGFYYQHLLMTLQPKLTVQTSLQNPNHYFHLSPGPHYLGFPSDLKLNRSKYEHIIYLCWLKYHQPQITEYMHQKK